VNHCCYLEILAKLLEVIFIVQQMYKLYFCWTINIELKCMELIMLSLLEVVCWRDLNIA
jgi:hypothetical protein